MTLNFIDTNVLIYANDQNAGNKQNRAIKVVTSCMKLQTGVLSIQVMQEYANIASKKLGQDAAVILRQLKLLEVFPIVCPSPKMVRRSVELQFSYRISFWDAGIIAAAEEADCDFLLSEDLNPGQYYAGLEVINPFDPKSRANEVIGIELS
ncbi:MAG: PIN domain-containing protein [Desulfohalobiaceae bacterium]|nr:PIN domain-containing protein [Desulfohalobiaceae bacterium]